MNAHKIKKSYQSSKMETKRKHGRVTVYDLKGKQQVYVLDVLNGLFGLVERVLLRAPDRPIVHDAIRARDQRLARVREPYHSCNNSAQPQTRSQA